MHNPNPTFEEQFRISGFLMALNAKVAGVAQRWKKGVVATDVRVGGCYL